jgi:hypothetical protein
MKQLPVPNKWAWWAPQHVWVTFALLGMKPIFLGRPVLKLIPTPIELSNHYTGSKAVKDFVSQDINQGINITNL